MSIPETVGRKAPSKQLRAVVDQAAETRWPAILLICGLGIAYGTALDWTVQGYDDAHYILIARSLAMGDGYRLGQGATPFVTTPMLPFLLTPIWHLRPPLPEGVAWFKLVPLACALVSVPVLLAYLARARRVPSLAAAGIVAVALLAPPTFTYAARLVMTELPYLLFSAAGLYLAHRVLVDGVPSQRTWSALALVLAAACLTRTVGLSLVAGVMLYLLWHRRWRQALLLGLLVAVFLLPWQIYVRSQGDLLLAPDQYQSDFLLREYGRPELGQIASYWEVVPRLLHNVAGHLDESLAGLFLPALTGPNILGALQRLGLGRARLAFGLCFAAVAALGWTVSAMRGATPLEWYVPLYLGVILLPPWYHARNLVPIAPFLLYYLWQGLATGSEWLAARVADLRPVARRAIPLLFALMFASVVASDRHKIEQGADARAGRFPAEDQAYYEAGDWLRANLPATAPAMVPIPGKMALYLDRSIGLFDAPSVESGERAADQPEAIFVVVQPERPTVRYEGQPSQAPVAFVEAHANACARRFTSQGPPYAEIFRCTLYRVAVQE
jgi:hypothetical protein